MDKIIFNTYKPRKNDLIYHYCSPSSFQSICQNRTIRLSDLYTMNDSLELQLGYSIWEKVAGNLIKELSFNFIDEIDKVIHNYSGISVILSASFSRRRDSLSQWRAYASDGTGYCIGFRARDMLQLPVYPIKVFYRSKDQYEVIEKTVRFIFKVTKGDIKHKEFIPLCVYLAVNLASIKHSSFMDEREIRIIHLLTLQATSKGMKLVDPGGFSMGKEVKGQDINFRFDNYCPITYQDYDFTINNQINPIKEIILGPKNHSIPTGISLFLGTIGINNVNVISSNSPYR